MPQSSVMKPTLDKDLSKIGQIEQASQSLSRSLLMPGLALGFIAMCAVFATPVTGSAPESLIIVIAAAIGAFRAQYRCQ